MRSIVCLLLKHARAGLGYVKNFVKNTNQPEPKKIFTLKTRIKNLGSDPRAIWCGFLRGFVDTKKGNENGEKPARNRARNRARKPARAQKLSSGAYLLANLSHQLCRRLNWLKLCAHQRATRVRIPGVAFFYISLRRV